MTQSIPKPNFPSPRRRSSIGQAAMASRAGAESAEQAPVETPPAAPTSTAPPTTTDVKAAGSADYVQAEAPHAQPAPTRQRPRNIAARSGGVAPPRATRAADTAAKRLGGSKDILLSLPEDLKERMVNTITWTQPHTGIGQQQKFIRKAIGDLCDRLERQYNNGNPFPPPAMPED
jgi:hypothetical protein